MIKNITDTSIEIPEETEVIDVCKSMSKAIEDLLKESREQGIEIGKIQDACEACAERRFKDRACRGQRPNDG